jgi:hypothetical protein
MADSKSPAVQRALDSLKRPVVKTSEDIIETHEPRKEPKGAYVKMARDGAANPPSVRH